MSLLGNDLNGVFSLLFDHSSICNCYALVLLFYGCELGFHPYLRPTLFCPFLLLFLLGLESTLFSIHLCIGKDNSSTKINIKLTAVMKMNWTTKSLVKELLESNSFWPKFWAACFKNIDLFFEVPIILYFNGRYFAMKSYRTNHYLIMLRRVD